MTTTEKKAMKEALVSRTPDQWLGLIRKRIPECEVQRWMANLICWNHPQKMGRHEGLVRFSEGIGGINATSTELETAHEALGLPYAHAKNDDEPPSEIKFQQAQKARDAQKLKEVTDFYESGWSVLRIANHYSSSCQSIGQLLRRHGVIGGWRKAG